MKKVESRAWILALDFFIGGWPPTLFQEGYARRVPE